MAIPVFTWESCDDRKDLSMIKSLVVRSDFPHATISTKDKTATMKVEQFWFSASMSMQPWHLLGPDQSKQWRDVCVCVCVCVCVLYIYIMRRRDHGPTCHEWPAWLIFLPTPPKGILQSLLIAPHLFPPSFLEIGSSLFSLKYFGLSQGALLKSETATPAPEWNLWTFYC